MSSGNPEILVINLGIDDQKVARFSLRLRDNPTLRVRDFCQIHSLPEQIEQQLIKHVLESREGAIRSLHEQTQVINDGEDPFLQAIDQQIRDAEKALVGQASKSSSSRNSLQKLQSPPHKRPPSTEGRHQQIPKQSKSQKKTLQGKHSPIKEAAQEHEERDYSGYSSRDDDGQNQRDASPAEAAHLTQGNGNQTEPGQLTSQRSSRRGSNIHSRLYYDGIRKIAYNDQLSTQKKLQESLQLQESQIGRDRHCSPRDVVSRLYYNGVKHLAIKHLEREKIKTQELSKELEGCTYTPAVSEVSKQLAQIRMQRGPQPLEDALIREGLEFAHRREQAAAYKTAQELANLRDKPETNPTSIAIAKERSRLEGKDRVSCHEALFEDSYVRRNRFLMETDGLLPKPECTFQPSIDPYSAELVRQKRGDCSVMERMAKYAAEKDQRLQENLTRKAITETMIDPETEQALFRPITGRAPSSRNTSGLEVGAFLHNISYQRAYKQKQAVDSIYDRKKTEVGANPQSAELVESRKLLLFRQLFEKLDSDGDGAISPDKVDVDAVEAAVLKYLAPLLINMDEIGAVLDEQPQTRPQKVTGV